MLEVKNLTKEYRPKKGAPVRALDGVSLKFPQKGMVFILGKSGCGKSTLLNLLGGLDRYDSGEIIIKGKSSADFKQSDFDSYRNTYLGFIFQEYNILNEFNVASNIALALELQGTKATDEAVNKILDEVDLSGYGGRKPTELSSGQKQRVAIARALVKNPEIILADEPTGALDSATGLQVFDTLKKLSQNKLIIVVTHDREFAESYGDRVIELKDGKVISDIERRAEGDDTVDGLTVCDDNTVKIKAGYQLTESDLALINAKIKENPSLSIVTDNETEKRGEFVKTDESKIINDETDGFNLRKSRLPIKNSVKIGASGLKNKPFRLVLTIFLSFISFTLFGLADTVAAYDKAKVAYKSLNDAETPSLSVTLEKFNRANTTGTEYTDTVRMDDTDVAALSEKFGIEFRPVYVPTNNSQLYTYFGSQLYKGFDSAVYYTTSFSGVMEIDKSYVEDYLKYDYVGKIPTETDEIAISKYVFSSFAKSGYKYKRNGSDVVVPERITDEASFLALDPVLEIAKDKTVKITAIIDTKFDEKRYEPLKKGVDDDYVKYYFLQSELSTDQDYGYHCLIFGANGFMDTVIPASAKKPGTLLADFSKSITFRSELTSQGDRTYVLKTDFDIIYSVQEANENVTAVYADENKTSLKENEILVSISDLMEMLEDYLGFTDPQGTFKTFGEIKRDYQTTVNRLSEEYLTNTLIPALKANGFFNLLNDLEFTPSIIGTSSNNPLPIKIAGVYLNPSLGTFSLRRGAVFSDALYEKYYVSLHGVYGYAIAPAVDKTVLHKAAEHTAAKTVNGKKYELHNGVMTTLNDIDDIFDTVASVCLYVGLGFAIFSALLLANFISTSVTYKKREIGILRALGAKASDVYGVFACESVIIALINFALSTVASAITVAVLNAKFKTDYYLSVTILSFGIRQIALILAISVGIALIASFIPAYRISKKRPVDAIRG